MFTGIVWRFLILETFVMGALSCTCVYMRTQIHFCESGFVLQVKILEEIKSPWMTSFWMKIQQIFKGDVRKLNLTENRSVILQMPAQCSVDSMKTGDIYVIFGGNYHGNIFTNTCFGSMLWDETSRWDHQAGLVKYYKRKCPCYAKFKDDPELMLCLLSIVTNRFDYS